MKKVILGFVLCLITLSSCNNDDDLPGMNSSRTLRYELSGNFSGVLFASYTTASGGTSNEQISTLPWNKEIIYNANVTAAIIAISGNGGAAGQQVTVVVKRGGSQISSTVVTANSSGSFTQSAPVVSF